MNNDIILKFLMSEREDDNLIGLNLIRARHLDNWGAFESELYNLLDGVVVYRIGNISHKPYPVSLREKYFYDTYSNIKPYYYIRID